MRKFLCLEHKIPNDQLIRTIAGLETLGLSHAQPFPAAWDHRGHGMTTMEVPQRAEKLSAHMAGQIHSNGTVLGSG